jgi:hypothetical protein
LLASFLPPFLPSFLPYLLPPENGKKTKRKTVKKITLSNKIGQLMQGEMQLTNYDMRTLQLSMVFR